MKKKYSFERFVLLWPKIEHAKMLTNEQHGIPIKFSKPINSFSLFNRLKRKITQNQPHTQTYIYSEYLRGFQRLGLETFWVDSLEDLEYLPIKKTLIFIDDQYFPKIKNKKHYRYVIHHSNNNKILSSGIENLTQVINLNNFGKEALSFKKLRTATYFNPKKRDLYQPWGCDLLSDEILKVNDIKNFSFEDKIFYIGTLYEESYQIAKKFNQMLDKNQFLQIFGCSKHNMIDITRRSKICFDIRNNHHKRYGYLPCRVLKTLGYGRQVFSNSKFIVDYLELPALKFFEDEMKLFELSQLNQNTKEAIDETVYSMEKIKSNHTFEIRADSIMSVFENEF